MASGCGLLSLPSGLLESIWPAKRVVLGLRVCKKLREELHRHTSNVALVIKSDRETWYDERMVRDFGLFSHRGIEISIQGILFLRAKKMLAPRALHYRLQVANELTN